MIVMFQTNATVWIQYYERTFLIGGLTRKPMSVIMLNLATTTSNPFWHSQHYESTV